MHVERDTDRKVETCRDLLAGLPRLDRELAGKKGLFLGKELSLVDVILAPALALLPIWSAIIGDKIMPTVSISRPTPSACAASRPWRKRCSVSRATSTRVSSRRYSSKASPFREAVVLA